MYPTHHALLYIGHDNFDLVDFEKEREATHDMVVQRYAEFRISDARSLISFATQTPIHRAKQCFVVMANSIAIEAQNALLKLLEEPPEVSSFVFVLPQNTLLATLRSRFMIMSEKSTTETFPPVFLEFVSEAIPVRLVKIATLVDKKETAQLVSLRDGLLQYLNEKRRSLSSLQMTRIHWLITQMPLRGSSAKMLWEDVAFTLPVSKL
jgi:DNA polymerase III delta prime subunit